LARRPARQAGLGRREYSVQTKQECVFPLAPCGARGVRCARYLAALAAEASEHGRHLFYDSGDFRSKTTERQYTNFVLIKWILRINTISGKI
jgi:hypothetical protein